VAALLGLPRRISGFFVLWGWVKLPINLPINNFIASYGNLITVQKYGITRGFVMGLPLDNYGVIICFNGIILGL
jgi:hypothetical protein